MKLYRLDYRAGWDFTTPLLSWCFVLADGPDEAIKKLTAKRDIHEDNVLRIEPLDFIP